MSGSSCIELSDKLKLKTYADFEFVLKEVQINDNDNNAPYTEKYQKHMPCLQSCIIDDRFTKLVVIYRGRHAFNKFIEAILKENDY